MPLQMNNFLKGGSGLINAHRSGIWGATTITARLYPTTVTYPAFSIESSSSLPAGHIWTLNFSSANFSTVGNSLALTSGTVSANTTAAGTFGWAAIWAVPTPSYVMITDSIGLSGSGSVFTVNTMTPTSGQSVNIAFSFSIV